MKSLLQLSGEEHFSDTTQIVITEENAGAEIQTSQPQPIDSNFLDAVCNGVIVVGDDMRISSQNYVSRVNMGDLRGQTCFKALENRDTPCEHCPMLGKAKGEFETSTRCVGSAYDMYEVRIYQSENGEVAEVYPNMIDREVLVKNLHEYSEELELLHEVVENISSEILGNIDDIDDIDEWKK